MYNTKAVKAVEPKSNKALWITPEAIEEKTEIPISAKVTGVFDLLVHELTKNHGKSLNIGLSAADYKRLGYPDYETAYGELRKAVGDLRAVHVGSYKTGETPNYEKMFRSVDFENGKLSVEFNDGALCTIRDYLQNASIDEHLMEEYLKRREIKEYLNDNR